MSKKWYVVHAYSGFEKSVQRALVERISRAGMEDKFGQILVPVEEVVEMKSGQKNISERKFFPGYVLVEMDMDEQSWHLVKNTPKVTGFVGGGVRPIPLTPEEADSLLKQVDSGTAAPREQIRFIKGDNVRIIDGPFLGFNGLVEEVDSDHNRVKVMVSIFGRSTPVELGFLQVERI